MKSRSVLTLIAALLTLALPGSASAGHDLPPIDPVAITLDEGAFVPDEVLVRFRPGQATGAAAAAAGATGYEEISLGVTVLKVPSGSVGATISALRRNSAVLYAEPNYYVRAFIDPNDPYEDSTCYESSGAGCITQWAWEKVQAHKAWDITTGAAVRIAVVDTGIDTSHPDLPPVILGHNFIWNNDNAEDDNGHGTHLAGIIGALTNNATGVAGANWNVSLLSAKALTGSGSGTHASIANAIIWAADNGAQVINLSLGGPFGSRTLKQAIDYAWEKGAVLACAAGNNGTRLPSFPAYYANCIAVAATGRDDTRASFSQWGQWVEVAAPGVDILSTLPDTPVNLTKWRGYKPLYDALSGTSMATPHVAGLAGLVWATGHCATNTCVRDRIEDSADPIAGTGTFWTKGRINYFAAVSEP